MSGLVKHPTMIGLDPLSRKLTKIIKKAIRSGQIKKLPAGIIWSVLFGIPQVYVRDWLDGYHSARPSEVSEELANACWNALKV